MLLVRLAMGALAAEKLKATMMVWLKKRALRLLRYWDRAWPFGRPALEYVETHLADHCNLNCRGCSHFSPLSGPWLADPASFQLSMERLSRLFRTIRVIRLMGGEPLLHPRVDFFLSCTRKWFPKSRIQLVTNGLLLESMPETFWAVCRESRVTIALTVYPPVRNRVEAIRRLCGAHGVRLKETPSDRFCVWMSRQGESPREESFRKCRSMLYCPVLKDGRIFTCATSAYIHLLSRAFGKDLPQDQGIDLGAENLTGREILAWLDKPVELCRLCALEKKTVEWRNGAGEIGDWFA